jgi:predicted Fe-S protein YdhL (DUF1289 family)
MSTKQFCDGCGVELDEREWYGMQLTERVVTSGDAQEDEFESCEYDLCLGCYGVARRAIEV